jgi:glycosyltransferase involved in cell wall biosynthesis
MSLQPLVSVSIITYQQARYIRECLEGVYAQQTDFPLEVLIGEDGSTDGTREICIEFAERYPDVTRLFLHDRGDRSGLDPRAPWRHNLLNNLQNAKGRYIAMLDGDDYWTDPLKLQKQIDVMESDPSIGGTFHDYVLLDTIGGTETIAIGQKTIPRRAGVESVIRGTPFSMAALVFRNDIDWFRLPDWFFKISMTDYGIVSLVAQRGDWVFLDDVMAVYRRHDSGMWSGKSTGFRFEEFMNLWDVLAESGEFDGHQHAIRSRRKEILRERGIDLGRQGKPLPAVLTFMRGFDRRETRRIISQVMKKSFLLASVKGFLGLKKGKRNPSSFAKP